MAREVDELFGDLGGAPKPRVITVVALLIIGVITSLLGLGCSVAPGGVVILLALMVVEKEQDRLENGYLPKDSSKVVSGLRRTTYGALAIVMIMFILQGWVLCATDYYDAWLQFLLLKFFGVELGPTPV